MASSHFQFDADETVVNVPDQASGKKIKIKKIKNKDLKDVPETSGVFKPGRLVINFIAVDADDEDEMLETFDPPLELTVRYTKADMDRAGGNPLTLAYYDEVNRKWVKFTEADHEFKLEGTGTGGFGRARIREWGDPQISWGP